MTPPAGIVVGGSAGALEGVREILSALPAGCRVPIAVALHVPARSEGRLLAEVLAACTPLGVREALDKEPFLGGAVYVAPPDYHLLLEAGPALALSIDEPVNMARPSIDVLFESAAEVLGARVVAALLSGANEDGARGLAAVVSAGGLALIESPGSAAYPAMPAAAARRSPSARALSMADLARTVAELAGSAS